MDQRQYLRNGLMKRPEIGIDYVLPLRWDDDQDLADLTNYLRWLSKRARIIIVDGSCQERFTRHHRAWTPLPST